MLRTLSRALVAACVALLAGGLSVTAWYARSPAFTIDFEGERPPVVSGLYRSERAGQGFFAWTSPAVRLSLPGADRQVPWACTVRLRGARPPGVPAPDLAVAVDGLAVDRRRLASDAYSDVTIAVPPRPGVDGLDLAMTFTPAFVPGPNDRRELGAQLTAFSCVPAGAVRAPTRALFAGGLAVAIVAATLALLELPISLVLGGALAFAFAVGAPLTRTSAPYGAFTGTVVATAAWVALGTLAAAWMAGRVARTPLSVAARVAIAASGVLLLLELVGLLHPAKALVDAVFHAHRLEWVMEGRYLFTQPMPSGVRFPYAIALYVVSLPFGRLFDDHVTVLKVVVLVSRALAGLLLYPVVVRTWNDRATACAAVCLFHLVPLPFVVIGNANMTYAFGQSVAVAAIAAAALVGTAQAPRRAGVGLFAVTALAFLSHVGIFPLLAAVLLAAAAGFRWLGNAALRPAARVVAASTVLAALFSVVVYYGHFGDAYRTLARVRAQSASAPSSPAPDGPPPSAPVSAAARPAPRALSLLERLESTGDIARRAFGWPLLVLAFAGLVTRGAGGWRDPLGLVLAATLGAAAVFVGASIVAPVEPAFWRYTAEFISRVFFVAMPALVVLAARATTWAWRAGPAGRITAGVAVLLAVGEAAASWRPWIG